MIQKWRESGKPIILLDSGDLLFRRYLAPVPENETQGLMEKAHLILESLQRMGYDAIGVGDDELTFGKDALIEMTKKADVPFLSSNLLDEASGKLLFQPYLVKKVNGLRIGIFSLLGPDTFLGETDPRKKGLLLRPHREVAQEMVKELKPKADLIILLSHLSYPRDMELAQAVPGINFILGAHTAMNLPYPPVIGNTVLLMTFSKGMYVGSIDLALNHHEPRFYNVATKQSLENSLRGIKRRLSTAGIPKDEKARLQKSQEDVEKRLKQLQDKNEFINRITPLSESVEDDPEIAKWVEAYKSKFPEQPKPAPPK
jgi:2',3'-cyclic-nucleotide 2'-phosphodiesterase (5'-nucleotidase family)